MLVTCNGSPVLAGQITRPLAGVWHAGLELDAESAPSGSVAIVLGGDAETLVGTVTRSSSWRERVIVQVVGGSGGLSRTIPAKAYRNVTARTVVVDTLLAAGERLSPYSDAELMTYAIPRWTRPAGPASAALSSIVSRLPDALWRVSADGTVWVGKPTWAERLADVETADDRSALERGAVLFTDDLTIDAGETIDGRRAQCVRLVINGSSVRTQVDLS